MTILGPCGLVAEGSCCPDWAAASDEERARASALAVGFLYPATGYQFGVCEVTVRPCGDDCNDYSTYWGPSEASTWYPYINENGKWVNCRSGSCACNPCNCCTVCAVTLEGPVDHITEVKIDGLIVAEEEYFVLDDNKLVRRVGCFPKCQNLQATDDEEGTFSVTYGLGKPLPPEGQAVLDELACEFLKSCTGGDCRLPARWRSITREGVSMDAFDNFDTLEKARIGIFSIDQWIAIVNPSGSLYQPYIPAMDGRPKPVRQTWP